MWDVDDGLLKMDMYTYNDDKNIRAGAFLGIGLTCCSIRSEIDPAYALLCEPVHSDQKIVQVAAVMGLGLAYAGTQKQEVHELLLPLVDIEEQSLELVGHACLSLGLTFAASADGALRLALIPSTHPQRARTQSIMLATLTLTQLTILGGGFACFI
jgi:26S proteasome regulatory subunit N1